MSYDDIYSTPKKEVQRFCFDENVVKVFDNMINRSVPGYLTSIQMIAMMVDKYAQQETVIYDLGCSLGRAVAAIRQKCSHPIVAVDNSPQMIERARENLEEFSEIEIRCEDVCDTEIHNASVVIMNFTLQFVPEEKREELLQKVYDGLRPGGILLLSEKVKMSELQVDLHLDFKRCQGYSELEIDQKRTALRDFMLINSVEEHQARLQKVGFVHNEMWFQCFNFVSFFSQKC